ncbi:protein-arginine omega-N asymmetric methyltransferase [Aureococcus anophagefferens]|nr:protein-arginine omega-N asymmetric methyltransferase [Aureococcus anophagefferens]
MASHVEKNDVEAIMKGSEAAKASDYANYFSSYAFIYHQKQMLSDGARMRAYRDAILGNPECFAGKVASTPAPVRILSMWAAQAGAKRVIACEFTKMADHAEALVAANGLQDVVEAHWMEMRDDMLAAPPARIGVIDLNTCTLAESRGIEDAPFRFPRPWTLRGVRRMVFFVPPAKVEAAVADAGGHPRGPSSTVGTISLRRQKDAVRLYNIAVKLGSSSRVGALIGPAEWVRRGPGVPMLEAMHDLEEAPGGTVR